MSEGEACRPVNSCLTVNLGVDNVGESSLGADDINATSDFVGGSGLDLALGHGGVFVNVLKIVM